MSVLYAERGTASSRQQSAGWPVDGIEPPPPQGADIRECCGRRAGLWQPVRLLLRLLVVDVASFSVLWVGLHNKPCVMRWVGHAPGAGKVLLLLLFCRRRLTGRDDLME